MADPILRQRIRASEAQVEAFVKGLNYFMRRNVRKLVKRLEDGDVTAKEAARTLGQIFSELEKAGLSKEIEKSRRIYADEVESIKDTFRPLTDRQVFGGADRDSIEALIQTDLSRVSGQVSAYTDTIRANMMRSVLVGERPNWDAIHDELGARVMASLETELNTSIQAFNRTVTINKAKDLGFDAFEYLGPDDGVTRPFCVKTLAGKAPGVKARALPIYTADEISKMDNGQGLPVMNYCGGYNCRHQWRPVSDERKEEAGL